MTMRMMRIGLVLTGCWLGWGLLGVGGAAAAPVAQDGSAVTIQNFAFSPATLTVPVGTTVTWSNNDQAPHTATARDATFSTGQIEPGQSGSATMSKAGTFEYFCEIHPRMVASITVTDAQAAPAESAAPAADVPMIEVGDQAVVNGTITVAKVVAPQDGWIAVHSFDADGKMVVAPPAGLAQVKAGTSTNVVVKLDKTDVKAGDKLAPMLHIDAGTLGTYEFPNGPDTPVQANGGVVVVPFTVQAGAAAPTTPAKPPARLPNTGATDGYAPLLVIALALIALGAGTRRRRAA